MASAEVVVSIFDMTEAELLAEADKRDRAGERAHAAELREFAALRGRATEAFPRLSVEQAMRRQNALERGAGA